MWLKCTSLCLNLLLKVCVNVFLLVNVNVMCDLYALTFVGGPIPFFGSMFHFIFLETKLTFLETN